MTPLILASSSVFRKQLLERLTVNFECISPQIDESTHPDESPQEYVVRLAKEKAAEIGRSHEDALIIGSDQCCVNNQRILGKPRDHQQAVEQLQAAAGKKIDFFTGVSIQHPASGWQRDWLDIYTVEFRELTLDEIERYLAREKPYNCAGSFKSEQLGISLCQAMHGNDPTALIGLPLMRVASTLREFGMQLP